MHEGARYLHFDNFMQQGAPIYAICNRCNREFVGVYRLPDERTDEVLLRMRAEFEAHQCEGGKNLA